MSSAAPTVWMVSPAWGRFTVTRLALAQRAHLTGELAARGINLQVLIVADDENLDIAREFGFRTLERPNDRLGLRFNDGIQHAAGEGADFITVVGSDDWVHPDLFDRLPADNPPEPVLSTDRPFVSWTPGVAEAVTGREIAIVDLASGRLRSCRGTSRAGVIPWVFPRKALQPCGFRPVPDRQQRGLDGAMVAGLGVQPEWVFHDPHDLCRVDFKSPVNLNTYRNVTAAIGYGDERPAWNTLADRYPAELVRMARAVGEQLAHEAGVR